MSLKQSTQHHHESTADLSFTTQLDGKTPIERWFHALAPDRAHSPSRTEVPWTAKRCKRLLRPFAAKLQVYKSALEDLVHVQRLVSVAPMDDISLNHLKTMSWDPDSPAPARKKPRRTYARRYDENWTTRRRSSANVGDKRRHDPNPRDRHSPNVRAHSLAWHAVQSAFLPIHDALHVYLPHQSFSPRSDRRAPSLMLMCLRRLPALLERTERECEKKNAMNEEDPVDEMYDFLEDRFGSKNGWKGFAYLLAAHVTTLLVRAVLDENGNRHRVEDVLYALTLSKAGFDCPLPRGRRLTLLPNADDWRDDGSENEGYFSGLHSLEYELESRGVPDIAHLARLRQGHGGSNHETSSPGPSYDDLIKQCQRFITERCPPRSAVTSLDPRSVLWLKQCSGVSKDVLLSANIQPDAILPSLWTLILWQEISVHLVPNHPAQCGLDDSDLAFLRTYDVPDELVLAMKEAFALVWRSNDKLRNRGKATPFTVDLRKALVTLLRSGTSNIKHLLFNIVDDYANTFPDKESMVLALKLEEEWQESLEDEELEKLQIYPKKIEDTATKRAYRFEESLGVWVTKTPYDYEERKRQMLRKVKAARERGRIVVDSDAQAADSEVKVEEQDDDEEPATVQTVRMKDAATGVSDMTPCPPRSIMLRLPPSPPSERDHDDLDGHPADALPRLPIIRRANPMVVSSMVLSSDELGG